MKVLTVVGARPQFIKAFPVSRALRADHEEVLVHTGQHYDAELSDVFFKELGIPEPTHQLGVGSASHAVQTARMLEGLEGVIMAEGPDVVLVYGDTNSTLAGALATAKLSPPLAHVEAGLRSFNRAMPEEINRVLTDHVSDVLLAPSDAAVSNLASEGLTERVVKTGDVMVDALELVHRRVSERSPILDELGYSEGAYILLTVHRAENTDDRSRLESIVAGIERVSKPVVFPCHPRTKDRLQEAKLWNRVSDACHVIDPVGYPEFLRLLGGAARIVTDSGGVQKEAFVLDTPCVTLRDETEWVETVEAGWNILVGADSEAMHRALDRRFELTGKPQPYGDGNAAEAIVRALEKRVDLPISSRAA
jgi:UDP-N-acetylglucosamine 2-epimerase (non-hydrolysing)